MEKDKNLEKQADALKGEELDSVVGGMRTSGTGNPFCPKCGSKMDMYINTLVRCPKCGYEYYAEALVLPQSKG